MGSQNEQLKNTLRDLASQFASAGDDLQGIKDTLDRTTKGIDANRNAWIGTASQQFQDTYHSIDSPLQHAIDGLHDISGQFTGLVKAIESAEDAADRLQVPIIGSMTTFVSKVKLPLSSMTDGADDWSLDTEGVLNGLSLLMGDVAAGFMIWESNQIAADLIKADQQVAANLDLIHNGANDSNAKNVDSKYYISNPTLQADSTDLLASPLAPVPPSGGNGSFPGGGSSGFGVPALGGAGAGVPALGSLGAGTSGGSPAAGFGTSGGSSIPGFGTSGGSSIPGLGTSNGSSIPGLAGSKGGSSIPGFGTSGGSSVPDLTAAHGAAVPDLAGTPGSDASTGANASQGHPASTDAAASSGTSAGGQILQGLAIGEMAAAVAAVGLTAATIAVSDTIALSGTGGVQAESTGADTPSVSGVDPLSDTPEDEEASEGEETSEDGELLEDEESSESEGISEGDSTPEGDIASEGDITPTGNIASGSDVAPDGNSASGGDATPEGEIIPEGKKTSEDEDIPVKPANTAKQKQTEPVKLADTEPIPQLPEKL